MRIDDERESDNIEDRRGSGGFPGGKGGVGIGVILVAFAASHFLGIDPRIIMQLGSQLQNNTPAASSGPVRESDTERSQHHLVAVVLADTEDTWKAIFAEGGREYRDPKLVLYRGSTQTGCGTGQAAMGPFYCSADEKVYLDLGFYDELKTRYKAPGEFAEAYVLAHEIGHHVQNLLGISGKVQAARQRAGETESNALSVKLELQADCLAGVWAYNANRSRKILEAGDIDAALAAASAVGDDTLQKQATGQVVPDSFTHGSSAQRVHWFKQGINGGNIKDCDTFSSPDA
jgi:predicted metalloprotease